MGERILISRISIMLNRKQLRLLEELVEEGTFKSIEEAVRGILDHYSEIKQLERVLKSRAKSGNGIPMPDPELRQFFKKELPR